MGSGTKHHKLRSLVGWGTIFGLPFAIYSAVKAVGSGSQGFVNWLSAPSGALGFLAFVTAAVWYCKLEMDEVILDYFDGGTRAFGLLANRIVAFITWAVMAFVAVKLAFLG
jgi:succinate dehydrogenase hydrophobic anchor subunit